MRGGSFQTQVTGFVKKTIANAEKQRKQDIARLFSAIIDDTPVVTGLLKGNWQATSISPASGKLDRTTPASPRPAVNASQWGQTVYLANNLPYARRIEYGYSKVKAPQGMVRKNIARLGGIRGAS